MRQLPLTCGSSGPFDQRKEYGKGHTRSPCDEPRIESVFRSVQVAPLVELPWALEARPSRAPARPSGPTPLPIAGPALCGIPPHFRWRISPIGISTPPTKSSGKLNTLRMAMFLNWPEMETVSVPHSHRLPGFVRVESQILTMMRGVWLKNTCTRSPNYEGIK